MADEWHIHPEVHVRDRQAEATSLRRDAHSRYFMAWQASVYASGNWAHQWRTLSGHEQSCDYRCRQSVGWSMLRRFPVSAGTKTAASEGLMRTPVQVQSPGCASTSPARAGVAHTEPRPPLCSRFDLKLRRQSRAEILEKPVQRHRPYAVADPRVRQFHRSARAPGDAADGSGLAGEEGIDRKR